MTWVDVLLPAYLCVCSELPLIAYTCFIPSFEIDLNVTKSNTTESQRAMLFYFLHSLDGPALILTVFLQTFCRRECIYVGSGPKHTIFYYIFICFCSICVTNNPISQQTPCLIIPVSPLDVDFFYKVV